MSNQKKALVVILAVVLIVAVLVVAGPSLMEQLLTLHAPPPH